MPNATELAVLDAAGAPQTINTLPVLGPATAAASLPVVLAPSATTAASGAAAPSLVAKVGSGSCCGIDVVSGATPGWLLLLDAADDVADGAVTPIKAWPMAANEKFCRAFAVPIPIVHGLVLAFSTTGPYAKTETAAAFLSADVT